MTIFFSMFSNHKRNTKILTYLYDVYITFTYLFVFYVTGHFVKEIYRRRYRRKVELLDLFLLDRCEYGDDDGKMNEMRKEEMSEINVKKKNLEEILVGKKCKILYWKDYLKKRL